MACHAARRLLEMNENLAGILAVEAMAAAQGVELRAPLQTSDSLQSVIATIRELSPAVTVDRIVSQDIEALARRVANAAFKLSKAEIPAITIND